MGNLLALENEAASKPSSAEGERKNLQSAGSGKQESAGSGGSKAKRRSSLAAPPPQKLPTVEVKKRDSETEVLTLLEIFSEVDRNNNGSVSKIELIKACRTAPGVAEFFGLPSYIRQEDG